MSTWDSGPTWDYDITWDSAVTYPVLTDVGGEQALGAVASPLPSVAETTLDMYSALPEIYPAADAAVGPAPFPLIRFLDLVGAQLDAVETLIDRFAFRPAFLGGPPDGTSDLVNPVTADPAWLPWLAQIYGVSLAPGLTVAQQRAAIGGAAAARYAGSRQSIITVAQSVLTGSQSVQLIDHVGGSQWLMEVITKPSESPTPDTVVPTIIAAGVKPAGVTITHLYYEASWATIEAALPTWAAWESAQSVSPNVPAGSWAAVEQTQPAAGTSTASWATIESVYPTWAGWASAASWAGVEAA